jgi:hypothetical protein
MRFFNTAGPCKSDIHYMIPSAGRLPGLERLVDRQICFVIYGPRRNGNRNIQDDKEDRCKS